MALTRIGGTANLLDSEAVAAVTPTENDPDTILVLFKSGAKLYYSGAEAIEVWRFLNPERDPGWRSTDE